MIYCVTAREVGRVKIGFSDDPFARLGKMQVDSPVALVLERIAPGDVENERAFHEGFAADRVRGEWFTITDAIERWMDSLPPAIRAERITPVADLVRAIGISPSYASMILSGRQRPSRPLAIHIFRSTGWRHPSIAALTDDQLATLEAIEPWKPRPSDAQVAA